LLAVVSSIMDFPAPGIASPEDYARLVGLLDTLCPLQHFAMLGLADRGRVMDLFEMILRGQGPEALTELSAQYADGADPLAILRDLAEITHWISVTKITPEAAEDPTPSPLPHEMTPILR
jgi:DNA polymerase III gamma/tau subunit